MIVSSFDELLKALDQIDAIEINEQKSKEIINEFWQYDQDDKNGFETIIDTTLKFSIKKKQLPKLYSFDIFDTLIQRKH